MPTKKLHTPMEGSVPLTSEETALAPHVSVYLRKGKWYFNTKSRAFESEEAATDAADRYKKLEGRTRRIKN